MIVEHRTYAFRPGTVDGWLKRYETEGLPIQKRHLGRFVGLYVSEIGRLHRIVLIWAYESLADREQRRAAMTADPAWQAFIQLGVGARRDPGTRRDDDEPGAVLAADRRVSRVARWFRLVGACPR